ncbi:hypothetical protein RUM44_008499 [Polyplax serrata]|uniref:Peptidase metallopeptidase domain-containing protein n=1 Tax=Polyplax serrata TaxID=468196 RepID=A0ABR1BCE9_POLSC
MVNLDLTRSLDFGGSNLRACDVVHLRVGDLSAECLQQPLDSSHSRRCVISVTHSTWVCYVKRFSKENNRNWHEGSTKRTTASATTDSVSATARHCSLCADERAMWNQKTFKEQNLRTLQPRNLDGGQVRAVLYHALEVWAKHSKLTFQELNSDRADILVYFHSGYHGDGYAFDGRGQVLAHAFFPGKERGGDAHFDEDEVWIVDPYADLEQIEGTSLFAVAAHEFGHSLGLSHSSVQGALMFPWYQGYEGLTPDLQLPDDDKHAIQQLYGAKDTKLWEKIPTYKPYYPQRPDTPRPATPATPPRPPVRPTRPTTPTTTPTPRTRPPRPTAPPPPPPPPPRPHPSTSTSTPASPSPSTSTSTSTSSPPSSSSSSSSHTKTRFFIFKGKYLWRIGEQGLRKEYPAEITRLWYGLPQGLTHVDAVYERNDKKIVFFIDKMYYLFDANYLMPGYPKPIHYLGLPRELERVDAAMVWGHNGKTYFFSGTMYWRFDEEVGRVELDYPRDMSMWKGVGYNIDAVFQWKDGKTYFFKNKGFWKFNDMRMRVENERQTLSAPFWMGCPRTTEMDDMDPTRPTTKRQIASSSSSSKWYSSVLISIVLLHCLITTSLSD